MPALEENNLAGSVRYYDALTNDARLVLDTLRSAERHGAVVLNYTRFRDAQRVGTEWICQLEDCANGRSFEVRARTIVNATGPWADKVPHSAVKLRSWQRVAGRLALCMLTMRRNIRSQFFRRDV